MKTSDRELPASWATSTLGEVSSKPQYGWTTKATSSGERLKLLRTSDISSGRVNWSTVPTCVNEPELPEKYFLNAGDIVVSRAGSVGKSFLIKEDVTDAVFASYLVRFTPQIVPEYVHFFMQSRRYWSQIEDQSSGIAIPNVNASKLAKLELPIAPYREQQRIVEKIETLFAKLEKGEEAVREVQKLLTRYRQSVLKAAVTGELTADWREERKSDFENSRVMLQRILDRRRETWGGRGKYKAPVEPEADELPVLPDEWCWATLDQLVAGKARAMQSGPFGSSLKHSEFTTEGILVIGIDNVRDGSFSMGNENRISPEKYVELEKYTARPNDLLVTVMASLGKTCVIPDDLETAIITKHVYRISMEPDFVAPDFYNKLLQTEWISRRRMFENAQGQTRPGLNSSILRALPVPLPSLAEQNEILRRLEVELSLVAKLDEQIRTELKRSSSLRQSILKDAFAGKLVPQDPNDEPASELLARIAASQPKTSKLRRRAPISD